MSRRLVNLLVFSLHGDHRKTRHVQAKSSLKHRGAGSREGRKVVLRGLGFTCLSFFPLLPWVPFTAQISLPPSSPELYQTRRRFSYSFRHHHRVPTLETSLVTNPDAANFPTPALCDTPSVVPQLYLRPPIFRRDLFSHLYLAGTLLADNSLPFASC